MTNHSTVQNPTIVARYGEREVELAATGDGLIHFAECLLTGEPKIEISLSVPADKSAAPFHGFLAKLAIEICDGKVVIKHDHETLRIRGATEDLKRFADNIRWLALKDSSAAGLPRDHVHIEHYPDHFYLAPDSDPLILVREESA